MTRCKGQLRASWIEQEYPHHVDIVVPPGGLGIRLDATFTLSTHQATARPMVMPMGQSFRCGIALRSLFPFIARAARVDMNLQPTVAFALASKLKYQTAEKRVQIIPNFRDKYPMIVNRIRQPSPYRIFSSRDPGIIQSNACALGGSTAKKEAADRWRLRVGERSLRRCLFI